MQQLHAMLHETFWSAFHFAKLEFFLKKKIQFLINLLTLLPVGNKSTELLLTTVDCFN